MSPIGAAAEPTPARSITRKALPSTPAIIFLWRTPIIIASSNSIITAPFSHNGVVTAPHQGQLYYPYALAINTNSSVIYVADTYNHRIQEFTTDGLFITNWGGLGDSNGLFDYPKGVAVDATGNVFVADTYNSRIQEFTSSGGFLASWGAYGSKSGQFEYPHDLFVDWAGNVYVADGQGTNNRIDKFLANGTFLTQWGATGSGAGQFNFPARVSADRSGRLIYVCDASNDRVEIFGYPAGQLASPSMNSTGQFMFQASGMPNYPYVVQTSTDARSWVFLQTNNAPFVFIDSNSASYVNRYYRTVITP